MTRFLMLLAAAAVAGAMYVAAAPGGPTLTRSGPTTAQFKALSKKVTALQKQLKAVKTLSQDEAVVIAGCLAYTTEPVSEYGAVTSGAAGYVYGVPSSTASFGSTTALDLSKTGETPLFDALGVNPDCASSIHPSASAASRAGGALQHLAQLRH